jgi:hypothetical protein
MHGQQNVKKVYGSQSELFYLLLSSVLLGFDQYLVIFFFLAFQNKSQPQRHSAQTLVVLFYVSLSA